MRTGPATQLPELVTTSGGLVRGSESNYAFFPGKIDEMSFYGVALTAREIRAIYDAGSIGKCR